MKPPEKQALSSHFRAIFHHFPAFSDVFGAFAERKRLGLLDLHLENSLLTALGHAALWRMALERRLAATFRLLLSSYLSLFCI